MINLKRLNLALYDFVTDIFVLPDDHNSHRRQRHIVRENESGFVGDDIEQRNNAINHQLSNGNDLSNISNNKRWMMYKISKSQDGQEVSSLLSQWEHPND